MAAIAESPTQTSIQTANDPAVRPFTIEVPQAHLDDLRERLARTRWPYALPESGWGLRRPRSPSSQPRRLLAHGL